MVYDECEMRCFWSYAVAFYVNLFGMVNVFFQDNLVKQVM